MTLTDGTVDDHVGRISCATEGCPLAGVVIWAAVASQVVCCGCSSEPEVHRFEWPSTSPVDGTEQDKEGGMD